MFTHEICSVFGTIIAKQTVYCADQVNKKIKNQQIMMTVIKRITKVLLVFRVNNSAFFFYWDIWGNMLTGPDCWTVYHRSKCTCDMENPHFFSTFSAQNWPNNVWSTFAVWILSVVPKWCVLARSNFPLSMNKHEPINQGVSGNYVTLE